MSAIGRWAVMPLLLALNACLLPPTAPDDLRLVAAEMVESNALPADQQEDIDRVWVRTPKPVLKIKFESSANIAAERAGWANADIKTYKCSEWDTPTMTPMKDGGYVATGAMPMTTSSLYWRNIDIFGYLHPALPPSATAPYQYYYYIDVARAGDAHRAAYNLRRDPEAVCFQITSAEMLRPGARSNVVLVPKSMVAGAVGP